MAKRIFITRTLAKDSIFRKKLEAANCVVTGTSLIEFEGVPIASLPTCDWIFFYSKNGVRFLLKQVDDYTTLPKLATIGRSTARFLQKNYSLTADFVGAGHPISTAQQFLPLCAGQQVLFARAKQSKQSVQKLLADKIQVVDLVVYDNRPKETLENPQAAILVFTSPMNAQTYCQLHPPTHQQAIVSIGQTTAQALDQLGINAYIVAEAPQESFLAEACLRLLS